MNYSLLSNSEKISYFHKAFNYYNESILSNPKLKDGLTQVPLTKVTILKYIRLSFGLSAIELSAAIGASPNDKIIVMLETGRRTFTTSLEDRITNALVIPPSIFDCSTRAEVDLSILNWYELRMQSQKRE